MIKAVIFDCFGVLVGQGFKHTYKLAGGDARADRDFVNDKLKQANLGLITEETFRNAMAKQLGISVESWESVTMQSQLANIELLNYIKALKTKYKTAILSNANTGVLERYIPKDLLKDCFDEVIVSADLGIIKPDPDIYKVAAKRLGVEMNECIFIDDKQPYADQAKRLGMGAIVYRGFTDFKTELESLLANSVS